MTTFKYYKQYVRLLYRYVCICVGKLDKVRLYGRLKRSKVVVQRVATVAAAIVVEELGVGVSLLSIRHTFLSVTMRSFSRCLALLIRLLHPFGSLAFSLTRRDVIASVTTAAPLIVVAVSASAADPSLSSLASYRSLLQQAASQLDSAVPQLIEREQWDSIRTILLTPPLSDIYKKPSLLLDYASAVGDAPNGDELAVLQARDDLQTHLRFLDMAAYNNVFNPIKSMGTNGATKQLVASYYEDPVREYKASLQALQELIELGK